MATGTAETFLATLAKSNLLSAEQLAEMGSELVKAGSDAQLQTLAKKLVDRGLITRWQAEQLFAGRSVFFLGKYKLLDYIGKGGMGAVFKAQHALMARTVALKVMARALLEKPDAVARFKREVKSAAALNHPNIITAHDADCVGDTHFLVMEYVEGRDLKYWLEHRGPLAIGWVCECIRQVSLGLQHAHEKGMVHRDIKPSNLLVDSKDPNAPPLVKILDMGLARMVSEAKQEGGVTQTGQVMGTVDYVAPEQAEDAKLADIRSDIFSLGCTLFQLLTGQLPFGGDTLMAKLLARAKTGALPVRSLRSDVPPGLEAIVAKMLARDPAQRLQTPGEVAAALAPFALSSVPGQVPAAPTAPPAPTGTASSLITAQSEADSNFTEFLDFMARDVPTENWASVSQTVGDQCGSPSAPAAPPAAITAKPRLVVAIAAAAVVALLLCLGGVVLFLTRGSKPVALEDQAGTESSPSGATKGSKKRTKQPEVPQPWDETIAKAAPQSTPAETRQASPADSPPPSEGKPESQPAESTPAATPGVSETTVVLVPKKDSPDIGQLRSQPRTLIVGTEKEHLPDLKSAFAQAKPGDTILIRHRGPLEFDPVDLSGKTPLTIAGDRKNNEVDFWPILRQAAATANTKAERQTPEIRGLFHADRLELTLKKLHLAAGGPDRAKIGAVFGLGSGRVQLEQCTVTVGVQGFPSEPPGEPIPLVQTTPENEGRLDLVLDRTFLRGLRLQTCVQTQEAAEVDITATQTTWAGGPAPWLVAKDVPDQLRVTLRNCTIYNVPNLLRWVSPARQPSDKPLVDIQAEKSLFVGPYANKEPFIAWTPDESHDDLASASASGLARWQGSGNVVHRFGGYFRDAKRRNLAALDRWRTLWGQTGRAMDREFDPMFRVWPDGYELQETYARDFQPRFERNKATGQRITEKDIGANHEQLPYALINIFDRAAATPDLAAKPRGMPRILRVHQKDGPYKTLEAAFADVRDEEIIEIADNGDYVPGRNFGRPDQGVASADTAVIAIPVANLTLRASDGCRPTITLDERRQEALGTRSLLLFYTSEVQSLQISGIHFHIRQAKGKAGGIVFGTGNLFWRWDNCSFTDASDGAQETPGRAYGKAARFQAIHKTQAVWIENNAYFLSPGLRLSIGIQGANWVLTRNCLSDGPFLGCSMHEALKDRAEISLVNCSVFGTPVSLWLSKPADQIRLKSTRNLFLQVSGSQFVSIEPSAGMARVSAEGSENLISWSNKPLNEAARSTGAGKLLPGPSAKRVPDFEGPRDPKNPYQPYRLKKGQEAGKMAADGGPVGVRFEYLPDPPALPPEFFQQQ